MHEDVIAGSPQRERKAGGGFTAWRRLSFTLSRDAANTAILGHAPLVKF
jgi:hypothetical protein